MTMLKQGIRKSLETTVQYSLLQQGGDETLAFDISKQCVTDKDVDECLEIMLEHVSEGELEAFMELTSSTVYQRYTRAITESMRVVDQRIYETLKLLTQSAGRA